MPRLRIAVLLLTILIINIAITGCLSEETKKTPKIEINLVGSGHKIYAGDTTTYVAILKNNRDVNDTIHLSLSQVPSGWDVTLNQTSVFMTKKSTFGFFVVVNSSKSAGEGKHKLKILAQSGSFDSKKSITITTTVISDSGKRVVEGAKVSVDYLGYLDEYSVFDTSYSEIGLDKAIRKASTFTPRQEYSELSVQVGAEDPDNKDPYIVTVEGFWKAIVGMREGQSRTVIVTPEMGYGNFNETTINTTEEVAMVETITVAEFNKYYPNEQLVKGVYMSHHFWQWNTTIEYFNETQDIVRFIHEPDMNQTVTPYLWDSKVIYKNRSDNGGEGRIVVLHTPVQGTQALYKGFPAEVLGISGNKIEIKFNDSTHNLANKNLIFDIKLVKIVG